MDKAQLRELKEFQAENARLTKLVADLSQGWHVNVKRASLAKRREYSQTEQDALAERILADLRNDEAWDGSFKQTTDGQWDRLVDVVRKQTT